MYEIRKLFEKQREEWKNKRDELKVKTEMEGKERRSKKSNFVIRNVRFGKINKKKKWRNG